MRYIHITGLYSEKIEYPNANNDDFVAGSSIDIKTMKREEVTGFEFDLPAVELPSLYTSSDFALKITASIKSSDTTITIEDTSLLVKDGFYWIKNELVKVTGIIDSTSVGLLRAQNGTFANNYYYNGEKNYYISSKPETYIGLRVIMYEDDNIISIGIISENPMVEGKIAHFNCDGLLTALEMEFPISDDDELISRDYFNTVQIFWMLIYPDNFKTEVPPVSDFVSIDVPNKLFSWSPANCSIPKSRFTDIIEFIDFYGQINLTPFAFDQSIGKFRFIPISAELTLGTTNNVDLLDYENIQQNYTSNLYEGISKVDITIDETLLVFTSPQVRTYSENNLELDFSGFGGVDPEDLLQIGYKYLNQFSVIYSKLEISTHAIKFEDFKEGLYYTLSDISEFYTWQSLTNKAMCIGKDNDKITFLIIRSALHAPITPGIPVTVKSGTAVYFGWDSEEFEMQDFIQTSESENLEDAVVPEYLDNYFLTDDEILLVAGGVTTARRITAVSGTDITINSSITDGEYWLVWNNYSLAPRQAWFFYDVNNY